MENRANFAAVTILRGIASVDFPEIGVKQGDRVYLARHAQTNSFCVVRWQRTRWVCSCGRSACEHKLSVNSFVFEESQRRRVPGGESVAHVTDELRQNDSSME